MKTLPKRTDSGIMLAVGGIVHRNRDDGTTVCGKGVVNPVSVSDADKDYYELLECGKCWMRGRT